MIRNVDDRYSLDSEYYTARGKVARVQPENLNAGSVTAIECRPPVSAQNLPAGCWTNAQRQATIWKTLGFFLFLYLYSIRGYIVPVVSLGYGRNMEAEAKQTQSKPRVLAVMGAKAAGKDELAHYLVQQYGALAVGVGGFARRLAEENESYIQYDVSAKRLADYGSEYIICWLVAETVENYRRWTDALVITGVRTPAEAAALKTHFGPELLLAYVKGGGQKMRHGRVQRRDLTTDPNEFQDFVRQDERLKSDYALAEAADLADLTLWNNDSLEAYYQQIETHIVPHLFPET